MEQQFQDGTEIILNYPLGKLNNYDVSHAKLLAG